MKDTYNEKKIAALLATNLFLCVLDLIIIVVLLYFEINKLNWLASAAKVLIPLSIIIALTSYRLQKHHLVRDPLKAILLVEALMLVLAFPAL